MYLELAHPVAPHPHPQPPVSEVVEHSTHNSKIKGLNLSTGARRLEKGKNLPPNAKVYNL
jgi:hypothetical protein